MHLPRNQLYVARISPKTQLIAIRKQVCFEKNLDPAKYTLRNPGMFYHNMFRLLILLSLLLYLTFSTVLYILYYIKYYKYILMYYKYSYCTPHEYIKIFLGLYSEYKSILYFCLKFGSND